MKTFISLLVFSALFASGCESEQISAEDQAKAKSFCNSNDPVNELAWLKTLVKNDICMIWLSEYKGKTVIVYDKGISGMLIDGCYYCDGVKVTFDNADDEKKFYSSLDLSSEKVVYKNMP